MAYAAVETGSDTISKLSVAFITVEGAEAIRADPNISPETRRKLAQSEASLISQRYPEHVYLLEDHDILEVYRENFRAGQSLGLAHIALIIAENPRLTFAELVTEYALDRGFPFIVALEMIEDLLEVEGTLYQIESQTVAGNVRYFRMPWVPYQKDILPPISIGKVTSSKTETIPGIRDNYLIQIYLDSGCSSQRAAAMLNISRQTFVRRMNAVGMPPEVKGNPDTVREWIDLRDKQIKKQVKANGLAGMSKTLPVIKGVER